MTTSEALLLASREALGKVLRAGWRDEWANRPNDLVMDGLAQAILDSGVLDAVKAEALREAADEAWMRATEATSEDSSWRAVTRWLRGRAAALSEPRP